MFKHVLALNNPQVLKLSQSTNFILQKLRKINGQGGLSRLDRTSRLEEGNILYSKH